MIRTRFPNRPEDVSVDLLSEVRDRPALRLGDPRIVSFFDGVGRRLLGSARTHPELGPLAAFLRRSQLQRELRRLDDGLARAPRGLMFQIAPGNVETIFVYAWALSALTGNATITRLSSRAGQVTEAVLAACHAELAVADPVIALTQFVIDQEHQDAINGTLSALCDLRVVWGGDEAVTAVRRLPLSPTGRDLAFPDRFSHMVLTTESVLTASPAELERLAQAVHRDITLYDQAACSSPGTVFWIGTPAESARAADLLVTAVDALSTLDDPSAALHMKVAAYGLAVEGLAEEIRFTANGVADLRLRTSTVLPRRWLGSPVLAHLSIVDVEELASLFGPKDQTLTYYGLTEDHLRGLTEALARSRGICRVVPAGTAFNFTPIWDGYDLLREFTRIIDVS